MSQSFGPVWMRPRDSNSNENQSVNQSQSGSNGFERDSHFQQPTLTPTLSLTDSVATHSSPSTPANLAEEGQELPKVQDVPRIPGGTSYSMQQMFDILNEMKRKNELVLKSGQVIDSTNEKYLVADGSDNIMHLNLPPLNEYHQQQQQQRPRQRQNHQHHELTPMMENLSQNITDLNINSIPVADQHTNNGWSNNPLTDPMLNPLLAQNNGDMNHFAKPPGLLPLPQLLQPHEINWVYLDSLGNVQGPFDGNLMQSWYSANYLTIDLRLRRAEETHYQTLGELMRLLNNFQTPFLVQLPDLKFQTHIHQPQATSHPALAVNTQQGVIPQRVASPWGQPQSPAADFLAGTQSPFNSNSPMLSADASTFATTSRFANTPQRSFIEPQQSHILNTQPANTGDDQILNQLHSTVIETVLKDAQIDDPKLESPVEEEVKEPEIKEPEVVASAPSAKVATAPKVEEKPKKEEPKVVQPEKPQPPQEPPVVKKEPVKPKLAPWASSSSVTQTKPKLSLLEIQELETKERLAQEENEREKQQKIIAAQLLLKKASALSSPVVEEKPLLPRTASWATAKPSTPVLPKKTLEEIQKEEAEAAKAQLAEAKRAETLASKLADTSSFANAAGSSGNPWTVITKKANVKPVERTSSGTLNMSSRLTNPTVLRSVSATTTKTAQSLVQDNSSSTPSTTVTKVGNSRDEFFHWCRQQLSQLNNGVNKEDVLSVLIQFPLSSESQEIVADTIYSNSSTMDGRRFAQEFYKKKQAIEKSIPKGIEFNWMDEMYRTLNTKIDSNAPSTTSSDNWDDAFKVVTKKNKKRGNKEF